MGPGNAGDRDRVCHPDALGPRLGRNATRWCRSFARWLGARSTNARRIQPTSNDACVKDQARWNQNGALEALV
jgi:hypothetical protein